MITKQQEQITSTREQMRGGQGSVALTALLTALPERVRLFSRITLQPGCSIGEHVHEHETELFYFISGSGHVLDDGARIAICAGDAMATGDGHSHSVINTGDVPLVILAAIVKD